MDAALSHNRTKMMITEEYYVALLNRLNDNISKKAAHEEKDVLYHYDSTPANTCVIAIV